jgi:hypothetical protein
VNQTIPINLYLSLYMLDIIQLVRFKVAVLQSVVTDRLSRARAEYLFPDQHISILQKLEVRQPAN